MKSILSGLLIGIGLFSPVAVFAERQTVIFEVPDARADFCGHKLQITFCRCAFDNEGCDVLNLSQEQTYEFVEREYREWVGDEIEKTARACIADGGVWDTPRRQCVRCTDGEVQSGTKCLPAGSEAVTVTESCPALTDFYQDWRAQSDFVAAEGATVSSEVAAYEAARSVLMNSLEERYVALYQQAIAKQYREALRAYSDALDQANETAAGTAFARLVVIATLSSEKELTLPHVVATQAAYTETIISALASSSPLAPDVVTARAAYEATNWNASYTAITQAADPGAAAVKDVTDRMTAVTLEAVTGTPLTINERDKMIVGSYVAAARVRLAALRHTRQAVIAYNEAETAKGAEYERARAAHACDTL